MFRIRNVIEHLPLYSALAVLAAIEAFTSTGFAASIAGSVVTADGKGVATILILHDLSTVRIAGSGAFDYEFSSKTDGSFSLAAVPAGKYEICVESVKVAVLDPCFWNSRPDIVDLTSVATNNNVRVNVEQGYFLQVRVNDPQGVLAREHSGIRSPSLSLRLVTANGKARSLRPLDSGGGQHHFIVVPYETPLRLSISSPALGLSDERNKRIPGNATVVSVWVPRGQSIPPVAITVGAR